MGAELHRKTFNEFWGELLLVRFHGDGREFREFSERRADWLLRHLSGFPAARVLDLGCGNGVLDLCLAARRAQVTAVDRIGPVMEWACGQAGQADIRFITADLRKASFPATSFDAVLLLGFVGLMSAADDAALFARARGWLAEGGRLLVDCPLEPRQLSDHWQRPLEGGMLDFRSAYDPESRLQHLLPTFHQDDGQVVELYDPYDPARPGADHATGVLRYVYSPEVLTGMLVASGFTVRREEHLSPADHYLLVADAVP